MTCTHQPINDDACWLVLTSGHQYDGAIMITASHLPFHRNGFKFFTKDGGAEEVFAFCI